MGVIPALAERAVAAAKAEPAVAAPVTDLRNERRFTFCGLAYQDAAGLRVLPDRTR
jgi:hypothetical protein